MAPALPLGSMCSQAMTKVHRDFLELIARYKGIVFASSHARKGFVVSLGEELYRFDQYLDALHYLCPNVERVRHDSSLTVTTATGTR